MAERKFSWFYFCLKSVFWQKIRCPDIQHNDTQHNDNWHNDTQQNEPDSEAEHNDTQYDYTQLNETQLNDTQYNDTQLYVTQHNGPNGHICLLTLSWVLLHQMLIGWVSWRRILAWRHFTCSAPKLVLKGSTFECLNQLWLMATNIF